MLLTVTAEDEGGKDASTLINITVLDQNDNDPEFLTDLFEFEVYQVTFEREIKRGLGKESIVENTDCPLNHELLVLLSLFSVRINGGNSLIKRAGFWLAGYIFVNVPMGKMLVAYGP